MINTTIENFDWKKLFSDHNIHIQVNLFNRAILNISRNFNPFKVILCDDEEHPWVNDKIKFLIK